MSVQAIFFVGIGAGMGAVVRFFFSKLNPNSLLPFGTFLVNLFGAFLLGFLFGSAVDTSLMKAVGVGFCGGLTTFSTMNLEIITLLEQGKTKKSLTYFFSSYGFGLIFCLLGVLFGGLFE
ncbi:CrcB protein [Pilibacter termitis]|uniref:Fluoride-specific ion channel FluC n=1 Tax=Pilibacter termitis TaxID=263852 RepID=A0A1T4QTL9_9ENTE|nr:CrcB family protein [Pilibacter termitis]SKA06608.1 CrcB protein [Pilibacter termitis]